MRTYEIEFEVNGNRKSATVYAKNIAQIYYYILLLNNGSKITIYEAKDLTEAREMRLRDVQIEQMQKKK